MTEHVESSRTLITFAANTSAASYFLYFLHLQCYNTRTNDKKQEVHGTWNRFGYFLLMIMTKYAQPCANSFRNRKICRLSAKQETARKRCK